jgi:regulator of nucleoside diphosphate kinase
MNRSIVITETDMKKLEALVNASRLSGKLDIRHLDELEEELNRAKVTTSKSVPRDVVTMHSRVRVTDLDSGKELVYQIVFPREADISKGKISVLAPIGTALLGYAVGSEIEWSVPSGTRRFRVDAIEYQPEADRVAV